MAPQITPILNEVTDGVKIAFKAMRFSSEPLIVAFLEKWDSLSAHDQEKCPIEAVAISANLDIKHLWGEMMLAIREQSVASVKIIAVASHPEITKKRVEFAKTPGGFRDRDALDTMLGALPKNQGISIFNKIFTGTKETEEEKNDPLPPEMEDDIDVMFPDCSAMQERVQPLRQKMLESRK